MASTIDLNRIFAPDVALNVRASPDSARDVVCALAYLGVNAIPVRCKRKETWLTEIDLIVQNRMVRCAEDKAFPGVWSVSIARGSLVGVQTLAVVTVPLAVCVDDREIAVCDLLRKTSTTFPLVQWWPVFGEPTMTSLDRIAGGSVEVLGEHTIWVLDALLLAKAIQTACIVG